MASHIEPERIGDYATWVSRCHKLGYNGPYDVYGNPPGMIQFVYPDGGTAALWNPTHPCSGYVFCKEKKTMSEKVYYYTPPSEVFQFDDIRNHLGVRDPATRIVKPFCYCNSVDEARFVMDACNAEIRRRRESATPGATGSGAAAQESPAAPSPPEEQPLVLCGECGGVDGKHKASCSTQSKACGTAHPQAPHIKCTLPKGHEGMHTTGVGSLLWDMAR